MRFLANENFPGDAVEAIRSSDHDVTWVRISAPGSKDEDILAWAASEQRVLLTLDKDFGELAWRGRLPSTCGVVLFRIPMPASKEARKKLAARVVERDDWAGHFTVVEPHRIRMRLLPD